MPRPPLPPAATRATASVLALPVGAAFYAAGRLRRGRRKPLHPDGAVLPGILRRHGAPTTWGTPWLDAAGEHEATVRFSRSAGLPPPLPDILGLAIRVRLDDRDADLLLSSTGRGRVGRFLLQPRAEPGRAFYTTLLPYRSGRGPVLIAAEAQQQRTLPPDPAGVAEQITAQPMQFTLSCASPGGSWERFGTLEVGRPGHLSDPGGSAAPPRSDNSVDATVSFDAVRNPLPGLQMYDLVSRIRARAYSSARQSRGLPG